MRPPSARAAAGRRSRGHLAADAFARLVRIETGRSPAATAEAEHRGHRPRHRDREPRAAVRPEIRVAAAELLTMPALGTDVHRAGPRRRPIEPVVEPRMGLDETLRAARAQDDEHAARAVLLVALLPPGRGRAALPAMLATPRGPGPGQLLAQLGPADQVQLGALHVVDSRSTKATASPSCGVSSVRAQPFMPSWWAKVEHSSSQAV